LMSFDWIGDQSEWALSLFLFQHICILLHSSHTYCWCMWSVNSFSLSLSLSLSLHSVTDALSQWPPPNQHIQNFRTAGVHSSLIQE
jgi:hypothetical protein